ncbi:isoaspartyl peptidase/L-asparaginase [Nemorincola caseinilytica]|uniref:Isoaspartyl peptidase/L-asparaginase n=1 Tax=Nemorincola caseinilytica TaxID=2054315 RepID=A0ABP8N3R9_9BACT
MSYTLVIHGGAGNITPAIMDAQMEAEYTAALRAALAAGSAVLRNGGDAVAAVAASIAEMENNPVFNAGRGSVFTKKGLNEMDAAIMNGRDLSAGAVAGVRNIKNPILLAREVMLHSGHVFLSNEGAAEFALKQGLEFAPDEYFFNKSRYDQWVEIRDTDYTQLDHKGDNLKGAGPIPNTGHKFGTVGAVACDANGNLAAGTSTGGMTNKRFNRIGDSPVIGAGTYANDRTCAISCTGHGELFLRAVAAYDVSCLIEYKGLSLRQACDMVIKEKLVKMGGEGGMIAVNARGEYEFCFNSAGMYRGMCNSEGREEVAYYG